MAGSSKSIVTSLYTHTTTPYYPDTSNAAASCTVSLLIPQKLHLQPSSSGRRRKKPQPLPQPAMGAASPPVSTSTNLGETVPQAGRSLHLTPAHMDTSPAISSPEPALAAPSTAAVRSASVDVAQPSVVTSLYAPTTTPYYAIPPSGAYTFTPSPQARERSPSDTTRVNEPIPQLISDVPSPSFAMPSDPAEDAPDVAQRPAVTSQYTSTTTPYYSIPSDEAYTIPLTQRSPEHPTFDISPNDQPILQLIPDVPSPPFALLSDSAEETAEVDGLQSTPDDATVPLPIPSPLRPTLVLLAEGPQPKPADSPLHDIEELLALGIPPFVPAPKGRTWTSTPRMVFSGRASDFYRLPQDILDLIVDFLAETYEPTPGGHFPEDVPKAELAACSLSCRALNNRCAKHLFAYFHFAPPGSRMTQTEGEEEYARLVSFLSFAQRSRRIRAHAVGVSLLWGLGMPSLVHLVDAIVGALPHVKVLRLRDSPCGGTPILPLPHPRTRLSFPELELGMADARPVVSTQQWMAEYLRLFHRINRLHFAHVISLSESHDIPHTQHLHVERLSTMGTCLTIFRALAHLLAPCSVVNLHITNLGNWRLGNGNVAALNEFLRVCVQNIEQFCLRSRFLQAVPHTGRELVSSRRLGTYWKTTSRQVSL